MRRAGDGGSTCGAPSTGRSRRPLRRPALLVALAASLCATGRAAATDSVALSLDYDVRFGPLRLLSMSLDMRETGDRYRARLELETQGLIGRLFPWRAESETRGRREGDLLRPERHRAEGTYRAMRRAVEIDYGGDGAVRSRVTPPPEQDSRAGVPDAMQQATIDPITASLRAVAAACRGTLPVFDGRRRYDMHLADLGTGDVRRGVYRGPARHCRATIEPHGGFWRSDPRDSETPARLDFWIASPAPGLPQAPVYLELTGARGTLAVVLRQARALHGPPA